MHNNKNKHSGRVSYSACNTIFFQQFEHSNFSGMNTIDVH